MFETKEIIEIVLWGVVFVGLVIWGTTSLNAKQCLSKYSEYQASYSFMSGCRVVWNGKVTPVDIIREIN